jgi:hypothetical protein
MNSFRPVSILERGLELNEDDFNYEASFNGKESINMNSLEGRGAMGSMYYNDSFAAERNGSIKINDGMIIPIESPDMQVRESFQNK